MPYASFGLLPDSLPTAAWNTNPNGVPPLSVFALARVARLAVTLHEDSHYPCRFADDPIIPCFHLDAAGTPVAAYRIDLATEERRELLATAGG